MSKTTLRVGIYAAVCLAVWLVFGARMPERVAAWIGEREAYFVEARNADSTFAKEQQLRVKWQQVGAQMAIQLHALERSTPALHRSAQVAIAKASILCRQQLAPVIVERDSLQREVRLAQVQHDSDLRLILSWQWQDTTEHRLRLRAESLLRQAPVRPSFGYRLFHPTLQLGVGPAWTLDDQRLHLLAVSVSLGWTL